MIQANDRVRLTVPMTCEDEQGRVSRLGVGLVFRVLSQVDGDVRVVNEPTGRRYILPAGKLARVGGAA